MGNIVLFMYLAWLLKGTVLVKIDNIFKIDLIAFDWIKKDSDTICNKKNQNWPIIRAGYTACQRMHDVITLGIWHHRPTAGNNIIKFCNIIFLLWKYICKAQDISGGQLLYRRCKRRMFVIYSSALTGTLPAVLLPLSCEVEIFYLWSFHRSQFAAWILRFLHLEAYLFFHKTLFIFFNSKILCFVRGLFTIFFFFFF